MAYSDHIPGNSLDSLLPANLRELSIKRQTLENCLDDFVVYIQSKMRMHFWRSDEKAQKKYKWIEKPEKYASDLLFTHLNGRYGEALSLSI